MSSLSIEQATKQKKKNGSSLTPPHFVSQNNVPGTSFFTWQSIGTIPYSVQQSIPPHFTPFTTAYHRHFHIRYQEQPLSHLSTPPNNKSKTLAQTKLGKNSPMHGIRSQQVPPCFQHQQLSLPTMD